MYARTIKVLSKDQCLAIAKAVMIGKKMTDEELLVYLPDSVFGDTFRVDRIEHDFVVYADLHERWRIPPYFVEYIGEMRF